MAIGPRVKGLSNMKFWYVVVMSGYDTLFSRRCQTVQEANALLAEKKEEYKADRNISVTKENY